MEPKIFFQKIFQSAATLLPITEAVAFEIPDTTRAELKVACHFRPSGGTQEQIANSIKAFAQVVMNCVKQKRNAALLIKQPEGSQQTPQYCLAHVGELKTGGAYAVAIVSPCKDNNDASMKTAVLARLCIIWQDQLPKPSPIKRPQGNQGSDSAEASSEPKVEPGAEPVTETSALPEPAVTPETVSEAASMQKSADS